MHLEENLSIRVLRILACFQVRYFGMYREYKFCIKKCVLDTFSFRKNSNRHFLVQTPLNALYIIAHLCINSLNKLLLMDYSYLKALHIIFVVTWFAGLFYIVRLFIYFVEAKDEEDAAKAILQKQYQLMSKRLWYGITWPSAVLTAIFATWLLVFTPEGRTWLLSPWMHIKLVFVGTLYAYHFMCHRMFVQLQQNKLSYSSFKLRIWNEVATILLFAIVFLVVLKSTISWVWGVVGIVLFGALLMLAINIYKKRREMKNS